MGIGGIGGLRWFKSANGPLTDGRRTAPSSLLGVQIYLDMPFPVLFPSPIQVER